MFRLIRPILCHLIALLPIAALGEERLDSPAYRFRGRHFRLTDMHGNVVKDVLA